MSPDRQQELVDRAQAVAEVASDLLIALHPWKSHGDAVREASGRLTIALAFLSQVTEEEPA